MGSGVVGVGVATCRGMAAPVVLMFSLKAIWSVKIGQGDRHPVPRPGNDSRSMDIGEPDSRSWTDLMKLGLYANRDLAWINIYLPHLRAVMVCSTRALSSDVMVMLLTARDQASHKAGSSSGTFS